MNKLLTFVAIIVAASFTSQSMAQCAGCSSGVSPTFHQPVVSTVQSYRPMQTYAPVQTFTPVQNYSAPVQSVPAQNYVPMQTQSTPYGTAQLVYSSGQQYNAVPVQSYSNVPSGATIQRNFPNPAHIAEFRRLRQQRHGRSGPITHSIPGYVPPQTVITPMGNAQLIHSTQYGYNAGAISRALSGRTIAPASAIPTAAMGSESTGMSVLASPGSIQLPGGGTAVPMTGKILVNGGTIIDGNTIVAPSANLVAPAYDATPAPNTDETKPPVPGPDTTNGDGT